MNALWRDLLDASREPIPFKAGWNIAIVAVFGAWVMLMNGAQPPTQDAHLVRTVSRHDMPACESSIPGAVGDGGLHRVAYISCPSTEWQMTAQVYGIGSPGPQPSLVGADADTLTRRSTKRLGAATPQSVFERRKK